MPPNTVEIPVGPEPEFAVNGTKAQSFPTAVPVAAPQQTHGLMIFLSSLTVIARVLVGAVVGISVVFSFRNGLPLGPTPMHIVLCVIGYQLLMAEGILCLCSEGGWSAKLTLVQRRRVHWILQISGSGLAIGGSIHKILDKEAHWDSLHGQFALVAMVFTGVGLINGLSSLYAYELRKVVPGNLSKITHICFGIVAFVAATASLIDGFYKRMFWSWATMPVTDTIVAFTVIFTVIIIINPVITFYMKTKAVIKRD